MLYIANDHAGYELKNKIVEYLQKNNIEFVNLGTDSAESVDFPVFCKKLVAEVTVNPENKGILICGTGIGMSICANRNPKIRAALCKDSKTAKLAREHNDANVLVLAGRSTCKFKAKQIVNTFLKTEALGGKYKRRMEMIDENLQN